MDADPSSSSEASPSHFHFSTPSQTSRPRSTIPVITPGEEIPAEAGFLRGHGTTVRSYDGTLIATVSGVVERVNKLVSVRPLHARYHGEVGDVVVCRITEVGAKRWKADVNGKQQSILMLSSINLPGGVQRRRTAEDQLNMRQFYVEGDLVSAEVQAFFQDGAMSLHTRSLKYGKLNGGVLVEVAPTLMRRLKQHFHRYEFGVQVIFGMNGFVWVQHCEAGALPETEAVELNDVAEALHGTADGSAAPPEPPTREARERVCRVRNALVVLARLLISVSPTTVAEVYHASLAAGIAAKDMLLPHVAPQICASVITAAATADQQASALDGSEDAMMVDAPAAAAAEPAARLNAEAAQRFVAHALGTTH